MTATNSPFASIGKPAASGEGTAPATEESVVKPAAEEVPPTAAEKPAPAKKAPAKKAPAKKAPAKKADTADDSLSELAEGLIEKLRERLESVGPTTAPLDALRAADDLMKACTSLGEVVGDIYGQARDRGGALANVIVALSGGAGEYDGYIVAEDGSVTLT